MQVRTNDNNFEDLGESRQRLYRIKYTAELTGSHTPLRALGPIPRGLTFFPKRNTFKQKLGSESPLGDVWMAEFFFPSGIAFQMLGSGRSLALLRLLLNILRWSIVGVELKLIHR